MAGLLRWRRKKLLHVIASRGYDAMDADSAGNPHLSAVASIVTAAGASEHESGHCTEHLRSIGCKTGKFPQELVVLWLVEASETAWATLVYSASSLHARQHT